MSHYGIDPSTLPDKGDVPSRDEIERWAENQVATFIERIHADFESRFGWYGSWDHGAIDAAALRQDVESAAWDVVRKSEADE